MDLKALVVKGIEGSLKRGLVVRDDVKAHWRARGEMTTCNIVKRVA